MLGDQVWLTAGVPVHPKDVGWGWGQGSVQFFHIKQRKPFLYGAGFVHGGIVMLKQERDKHKRLEGVLFLFKIQLIGTKTQKW